MSHPDLLDVLNGSLEDRLSEIETLEFEIVRLFRENSDNFHGSHEYFFFLAGALKRTLCNSSGFRSLVKSKNFTCAAPIVRMQIDTAMRVNGLSLVESPDEFCKKLVSGMTFDKMKCRDDKLLKDSYLREKLSKDYSWIDPVYRAASDTIHLSVRHFRSSIIDPVSFGGSITLEISTEDPWFDESMYFEAFDVFFRATELAAALTLRHLSSRRKR